MGHLVIAVKLSWNPLLFLNNAMSVSASVVVYPVQVPSIKIEDDHFTAIIPLQVHLLSVSSSLNHIILLCINHIHIPYPSQFPSIYFIRAFCSVQSAHLVGQVHSSLEGIRENLCHSSSQSEEQLIKCRCGDRLSDDPVNHPYPC